MFLGRELHEHIHFNTPHKTSRKITHYTNTRHPLHRVSFLFWAVDVIEEKTVTAFIFTRLQYKKGHHRVQDWIRRKRHSQHGDILYLYFTAKTN